MADARASASVGFPILTFITGVLLVLKLAGLAGASWGLATLSWWWVFSPMILGAALAAIGMAVFLFIVIILFIASYVSR